MPDAFRLVDIMLQIQQLIAWEDKASMKAHFSLSDVLIGQSKVSFMGITCSGYAHHGDYLLRLCTSSLYQMLWGLKGIFVLRSQGSTCQVMHLVSLTVPNTLSGCWSFFRKYQTGGAVSFYWENMLLPFFLTVPIAMGIEKKKIFANEL